MHPDDAHWYCLRTQPKHEHIAAARLRQSAKIDVFAPQLRFQRSTRRGLCWFVEAMFPGYIFARFPFVAMHREVQAANGVAGIVHFGRHFVVVPDSVIAMLSVSTGTDHVAVIENEIEVGEVVEVAQGPLSGLQVLVTQVVPGHERIRVLLDILGQQVEAEVARDSVLGARRHPLSDADTRSHASTE